MDEEKRRKWYTHVGYWLLTGLGVVVNIEYSILMPTIWSYVKMLDGNKVWLGVILASFSASRLFAFFPLGIYVDHFPMIHAIVVTIIISILGNFLYGLVPFLHVLFLTFLLVLHFRHKQLRGGAFLHRSSPVGSYHHGNRCFQPVPGQDIRS